MLLFYFDLQILRLIMKNYIGQVLWHVNISFSNMCRLARTTCSGYSYPIQHFFPISKWASLLKLIMRFLDKQIGARDAPTELGYCRNEEGSHRSYRSAANFSYCIKQIFPIPYDYVFIDSSILSTSFIYLFKQSQSSPKSFSWFETILAYDR